MKCSTIPSRPPSWLQAIGAKVETLSSYASKERQDSDCGFHYDTIRQCN